MNESVYEYVVYVWDSEGNEVEIEIDAFILYYPADPDVGYFEEWWEVDDIVLPEGEFFDEDGEEFDFWEKDFIDKIIASYKYDLANPW